MIYDLLAPYYDEFLDGVDYSRLSDFLESCFSKYLGEKPELVLDLACGTGKLTAELALRGYDMTGVDYSADMLSCARERAASLGLADKILYLNQDICDFELYGTVGACVCTLDGINHLTSLTDLRKTLSLVHNYLDPDGLFIFDINGKGKFEGALSDRTYVYEKGDDTCIWQSVYNEKARLCDFYITLFKSVGGELFERYDEVQRERMYTVRSLSKALAETGFELLSCVSDYGFTPACDADARIYFIARCKK